MKTLKTLALFSLVLTTQAFAAYEVIGETKDCPIHTNVIRQTSGAKSSLLVIHERDVYELKFKQQTESIKVYASSLFEATIMGPEMAVLSRLKIYLGATLVECEIDL